MTSKQGIVLITGSSGRIGAAVMQRLTGRFSDVVGFDRKAPSPPRRAQQTATLTGQRCLQLARRRTIRRDSYRTTMAWRCRWKMHISCGCGDSYGNYFDMAGKNDYHIKLQIRRPDVPGVVEATFTHRHAGR